MSLLLQQLLLIVILFQYYYKVTESGITMSPQTVDTNVNIQISVFDYTQTQAGSTIQIQLPPQFYPNQLRDNSPYSGFDQPNNDLCAISCTGVSINYLGGYILEISGMYPDRSPILFVYTIFNVPTPKISLTTSSFEIRVKDTSGGIVYSQTASGITLSPKIMTCSGAISVSTLVSSTSSVTFTINPITQPTYDPMDYVKINFPSKWANENIVTQTISTNIYCSSPSQNLISCQKSGQNVFASNLQYMSTFDITIQQIFNPSSVMSAGIVTITTMSDTGKQINYCQLELSGFTPDVIVAPSLVITYTSDATLTLKYSFTISKSIQGGTKIIMEIPIQITLNGAIFSITRATNIVNPSLATYHSNNNSLVIDPFAQNQYNNLIQITCSNVIRPRNAILISQTKISTYYNDNIIASSECCQKFLAPRQTLSVDTPLVIDKPYLLTNQVQYTFTLNKNSALSYLTTDQIQIRFPQKYAINNGPITCSLSSDSAPINPSPTCSVSNNLLKILNFITADYSSPAEFTLRIQEINNPAANPSSDPFIILVASQNDEIIERNTASFAQLEEAIILALTITPSSFQTYDKDVTLSLVFTTNSVVKRGYIFQIIIPTDLKIDHSLLQCSINLQNSICWQQNSQIIHIETLIDETSTSITINIDGITNPNSLQPTGSFSLNIYDEDGNRIQKTDPALNQFITMTAVPDFPFCSASLTTIHQVYSQSTLSIKILPIFPIQTLVNLLTIEYSTTQIGMNIGGTSTCTGCSFSTGSVTKTLQNDDTFVELNINNVVVLKEITSSAPTITIKLHKVGGYLSTQSTIQVSNITPAEITYSLSQNNWVMSEPVQIIINYNIDVDTSPPVDYLLVKIPPQYSAPSLTDNTFNYSSLSGTITLSDTLTSNPSIQYSSYFYIGAFSASHQLIAISTNNYKFQLVCDLPCKTCDGTTNCTSCYNHLTSNIYLVQSGVGTCVSYCPPGYYHDITTVDQCLTCDPNCLTCSQTSSIICLTCALNQYLHQVDNKCYSSCPSHYFQDKVWCTACPDICNQCLNQTYCTQCESTLYLYQNSCLISCPPSTFTLTSPLRCFDCPVQNCLFCTQTNCLTCSYPYYLYNNICYSTCPTNLLPNLENKCTVCECQTCQSFSYRCTSCLPSKPYLFNNFCYTNCPDGTFSDLNNQCINCPNNCIQCLSITYCTLCEEDYGLLTHNSSHGECISSCPDPYILTLDNSLTPKVVCQQCTFPCETCSISVNFCQTCYEGYSFHNNTCVLNCPANLHSIDGICQLCIAQCQNCTSDPYNCTQCNTGYYLYLQTCFTFCPAKTYTDPLSKACIQCNTLCSSCENSTNCTACINGYFLFNNFCYQDCPTVPIFYYEYQGNCQLCQPQCSSCLNSPIQCSSCITNEYFHNIDTKQCTFSCQQPYYQNQTYCVPCQNPCQTCQLKYNVCQTCIQGYFVYQGTCLQFCPQGYFSKSTGICVRCEFPCHTCIENQCIQCESFAYLYKTTCVLQCPSQMPYKQSGYCSQCLGVGLCAICADSDGGDKICSECAYPYVLFNGGCLNSCPQNYTISQDSSIRQCTQTQQFKQYLSALKTSNSPIIPPMFFFALYLIIIVIFYLISKNIYRFTYHTGYFIGLQMFLETSCMYYVLLMALDKYLGQYHIYNVLYIGLEPLPSFYYPIILLGMGLIFNSIIIGIVFCIIAVKDIYYKDARYHQYIQNYKIYWVTFIFILMPVFGGHRLHKINYSKLFGLRIFAFRITSVSKFQRQDYLTFCTMFGDLCQLSAAIILILNLPLQNNVLLYGSYEIICFKFLLWVFLYWDLKKPDRGFFMGDQRQAQLQIQQQLQQQQKRLKRVDTENLARLVRTKSAAQLQTQKIFGEIFIDDNKSVYNPEQYEDVPKVPKRKIQKNIYKGNFRKGRKITIEQKLNRFIDSIKPRPKKKQDRYIKDLLYWRPPKKIKVRQIQKPSEESMMELLNKKQNQYRQDIEEAQYMQKNKRNYYIKPRYNNQQLIQDIDETIPNQTVDFFYPTHSIESHPFKDTSVEYDDLMNLNYAKKKHLNKKQHKDREESLRVLHHNPKKKRRNMYDF